MSEVVGSQMLKLSQTWKVLSEAFRQSLAIQNIGFAFAGLLLTALLWQALGATLLPQSANDTALDSSMERAKLHHKKLVEFTNRDALPPMILSALGNAETANIERPISPGQVYWRFSKPVQQVFSTGQTWSTFFFYLLGSVATVLVWSFCGLPIVRRTVVRIGSETNLSASKAIAFARRKGFDVATAVYLPAIAMMLMAIPAIPFGLLMRSDTGAFVAGCLWILILVVASLTAVLAVGLMISWPLMWGAVAADDCDAFDAISRAYAYASQRPLHYLCYAAIAIVLGYLGWLFAWAFVEVVIGLAFWSVELGSGADRMQEVMSTTGPALPGIAAIRIACRLCRGLASAYSFSFFFSMSGGLYMLLRRDTDETELDQVFELGSPSQSS